MTSGCKAVIIVAGFYIFVFLYVYRAAVIGRPLVGM